MTGTGTTIADGSMALGTSGNAASYEPLVGRTLDNYGTATVAFNPNYGGNGLYLASGATLNNEAGASFAFVSDTGIGVSTGGGTLVNAGTLSKTGGTGTSIVAVTLNDTGAGTVQVSSGTLSLQGTTTVANSARCRLPRILCWASTPGWPLWGTGRRSRARGTVAVRAGTFTIPSGTVTSSAAFSLSGGTISGAGTLTLNGALTWNGGTMSGTGTTITNGTVALGTSGTSSSSEPLIGWTLENFGTATVAFNPNYGGNGLYLASGATLNNEAGASFAFVSDTGIGVSTGGGTLVNAGTLSKTGGTGTSAVAVAITDTGTVQASSGTLSLQGGGTISGTATSRPPRAPTWTSAPGRIRCRPARRSRARADGQLHRRHGHGGRDLQRRRHDLRQRRRGGLQRHRLDRGADADGRYDRRSGTLTSPAS